jgi:WD40 repeat protein/serine/threonine protein kinase
MPSTEIGTGEGTAPEAEEFYLRHLARSEAGEDVQFEQLCAEHPEHESAFRQLQAAYGELESICAGELPEATEETDSDAIERLVELNDTERYAILEEIGRGGMGTVHRVWDARLKRTLAMKVSVARRGGASGRSPRLQSRSLYRFLDEAQVMGQLDHPGVLPVHDIGLDPDGHLFFTMHLVRGHDLKHVIDAARRGDGGWTLHRFIGVLVKVCETLAYAHAKGVIHRDLKPSNVMVGRLGETYVTDWGLARIEHGSDPHAESLELLGEGEELVSVRQTDEDSAGERRLLTLDGSVMGTPGYMAPEQSWGRVDEIGPRTDVYAVGAMLYHFLSGGAPYSDRSSSTDAIALLHAVRSREPTPVAALAPEVPPELCAVVEKAMQRDPSERYPAMEELAEDLRAFVEGRVVRAWRTGPVIETQKLVRRNPVAALAIAAAAATLVFGTIAFAWFQTSKGIQLDRVNEDLTTANQRIQEESALATRERARADRQAYGARIAAAQAWIGQHRADLARTSLDACRPELRGWEWRHLDGRVDRSESVFRDPAGLDGRVSFAVFTPDGSRIVAGQGHEIRVWEGRDATAVRTLARHDTLIEFLAIDSTGRWIAVADYFGEALGLYDLEGEMEGRLLEAPHQRVRDIAFHPREARFIVAFDDGLARLFDVAEGRELAAYRGDGSALYNASFSSDGGLLVTSSADNTLRVLDVESGELVRERRRVGGEGSVHRWPSEISPDGTRIAVGTNLGDVYILDARSLAVLHVMRGHAGLVWDLQFSPDGAWLATASNDHTVRVWDVATGALRTVGRGHRGDVNSVSWSPNGDRLLSASDDGTLRTWAASRTWEFDRLAAGRQHVRWVDFHPAGKIIATAGPAPGILLWDAVTGDVIDRLSWASEDAGVCRFDPTGERLVTSSTDHRVFVWNLRERTVERILEATPGYWTYKLDFRPDGKVVAVGSDDGSVWVWDLDTGVLLAQLEHGPRIGEVVFSPDGSRLLVGLAGGGDLVVHETENWQEVGRIRTAHDTRVTSISFHPKGHVFASVGRDVLVRLWSARTLEPLASLEGHTDSLQSVVFHPDGSRLATGGRDGSLKLWDFESLTEAATLGGSGWVGAMTFSPDGTMLCSTRQDDVRLWETNPGRRNLEAVRAAEEGVRELVEGLFRDHHRAPEVVALLEARGELEPLELRAAVGLARATPDGPRALGTLAWTIAREANLSEADYERALAKAEAALELEPAHAWTLDTKAAALFRLGRTEEALDALLRADSIRRAEGDEMTGRGGAFLALSYGALGMKQNAAGYAAYTEEWTRRHEFSEPWWDRILAEVRAATGEGE